MSECTATLHTVIDYSRRTNMLYSRRSNTLHEVCGRTNTLHEVCGREAFRRTYTLMNSQK